MAKALTAALLLALLLNSVLGVLITPYSTLNWLAVDFVILLNWALLVTVSKSNMSDGNRVSLFFALPLCGTASLIAALFLGEAIIDSIPLITIIVVSITQLTLLTIVKIISRSVK